METIIKIQKFSHRSQHSQESNLWPLAHEARYQLNELAGHFWSQEQQIN